MSSHPPRLDSAKLLAITYTITISLGALLLFVLEPMFAKMVLPLLGGSPAVWDTAMVFYQLALLIGYLYAHAAITWLGVRRQAALHVALLLTAFLVLPISIPHSWGDGGARSPVLWMLSLMLLRVGLPFTILAGGSITLQKWFAETPHPAARDPYFLFAASNVGSFVGLLAYPLLIEPRLSVKEESWAWMLGFGFLVFTTVICAGLLWMSPTANAQPVTGSPTDGELTLSRRLRWAFLAFLPSSLMLGVTTYLSTNITPFPLLWVIPLALYLLTFILAFAGRQLIPRDAISAALPIVLLPTAIARFLPTGAVPLALAVPLHLLNFLVIALACHSTLAADRPSSRHLGEFYLWLALGGAVGGVFNGLLARMLFKTTAEYPLTLMLACFVALRWFIGTRALQFGRMRAEPSTVLALVLTALFIALQALRSNAAFVGVMLLGLPFLVMAWRRPLQLVTNLSGVVLMIAICAPNMVPVLYLERNFFGVVQVRVDSNLNAHVLAHGDTLHGAQSLDTSRRCEAMAYYYTTGPIGQLFAAFPGESAFRRVAVVGLGTGSLAAYHQPGQQWTFYEIDPIIERVARDDRYFTFLRDCAPDSTIVAGDGRLSLASVAPGQYNLIILDAFSSDSIPIHLLTREALALYFNKLAPGGVLACNISNRYLALQHVFTNLARDAQLASLYQADLLLTDEERKRGKVRSEWVLLARSAEDFGSLARDGRWTPLTDTRNQRPWTDDYSSIVSVIRWK